MSQGVLVWVEQFKGKPQAASWFCPTRVLV